MKVVVTGGAGFIGSHVAERLLAGGHQVIIIDDFCDSYDPGMKHGNINALTAAGNSVRIYKSDITNQEEVFRIIEIHRPEAIIHLAARAGVRPSLEQPLLYEKVNVSGTMAVLEAARRLNVERFIFASSSSVYGIANRTPFREDDHVSAPISPYAATKLAGEGLCHVWAHLYGLQMTCLRFFTVYGPRQRPDLAIRKFTELILRGCPVPVYGDGLSGRDYTFVNDIVDGVIAALHRRGPFEIINLGNAQPISLLTMIRTIEACLHQRAQIQWLPDQPGDVPITFADISKAQALLKYNPVTEFASGIQQFVDWRRGKVPLENPQVAMAKT